MSMSTEAVLAMASKLQESRAESNPVEEVKEGMQPEAVETNDTLPDDKNVSDGPTVQETEEPSEPKPTDTAPKAVFSKQEQQNHAFTKLKAKERAKREKLEARIRELEEQNRRYKDVKLDTFDGDQEKYTDFVVERKLADAERNRLLEEKRQSQLAEYDAINEQRVNSCFKDEKDRANSSCLFLLRICTPRVFLVSSTMRNTAHSASSRTSSFPRTSLTNSMQA